METIDLFYKLEVKTQHSSTTGYRGDTGSCWQAQQSSLEYLFSHHMTEQNRGWKLMMQLHGGKAVFTWLIKDSRYKISRKIFFSVLQLLTSKKLNYFSNCSTKLLSSYFICLDKISKEKNHLWYFSVYMLFMLCHWVSCCVTTIVL